MKTHRLIALVALIACLAGGMAWAAHSRASAVRPDVLLGPDIEITDDMQVWIDQCRIQAGAYLRTFDGYRMILIARGEKPTAGYSVTIEDIGQSGGTKWIVDVSFADPAADAMVAEVISYPYSLVGITDDGVGITVRDVSGSEPVELPLYRGE